MHVANEWTDEAQLMMWLETSVSNYHGTPEDTEATIPNRVLFLLPGCSMKGSRAAVDGSGHYPVYTLQLA